MSPTDRYAKSRGRNDKEIKCRLCGRLFFNEWALSLHLKFSCEEMKKRMDKIEED